MAGVKGRSGGARTGAGRKPELNPDGTRKNPPKSGGNSKLKTVPVDEMDMLELLKQIALGRIEVSNTQLRAASVAVQYTHPKKGESSGAKEAKEAAAKAAASGRFGQRRGPTLAANGGKVVE
ncbi:MAG: hypothetical protein K0R43_1711 [Pseudoduganella sp.]|jgi:hypothetical protein|nr:hypothetical protein [Pseudoduganella sp.]